MKKQVFNPYLPEWEYVPDGEPHLFDGRVYIYGSHDKAFGEKYCEEDYVTWSAPEEDLSDWRYEGVIYKKTQDPSNSAGEMQLWAPDVTKGPDGRYYLYYCFSFYPEIGVAVSDSPAGPFEFYGHVHYPVSVNGGRELREFMPFDPAVLTDDDGRVYLYYGFAPAAEKAMIMPSLDDLSEEEKEKMQAMAVRMADIHFSEYNMVAELEPDMLTLKEVPREMIPSGNHTDGTGFEGHGFFEASSIRKVGSKYYFVYSSSKSHELCYAVSDYPDRDFVYGGTLVSNGDMGLNGRTSPVNVLGNNHGGMVQANGQWYIFYHRQTNGTEYSRQGCAEKITIDEKGKIAQAEITSCGLNDGPLKAEGSYPAYIACHITDATTKNTIDYGDPVLYSQTRITSTEDGKHQYVTDVHEGSTVGFKYFKFEDVKQVSLEMEGDFSGKAEVRTGLDGGASDVIGTVTINGSGNFSAPVAVKDGIRPLYFCFSGKGSGRFKSIAF